MDSRQQFEESPRFKGMDFTRSVTHPDYYESPYANGAWDGWQASRESLLVELQEGFTYHGQSDQTEYGFEAQSVVDAIHATGIRTK